MKWMIVMGLAACGGAPQTRYYQLAAPVFVEHTDAGSGVLAVEPLSAEGAYDDERIVYRVDPVRLDYYQYHRWSTTPGALIGRYLQQGLEHSGKFRSVVRDTTADTAAVLAGRVVAIEEIDESKARWVGHLAIELTLTDPKTGDVLWSHAYDRREPLAAKTPEGLATALGVAMDHIIGEATPAISDLVDRNARASAM